MKKRWLGIIMIMLMGVLLTTGFVVAQDENVATPKADDGHSVTFNTSQGGTVTADVTTDVSEGDTVTLTVTPDDTYLIQGNILLYKSDDYAVSPGTPTKISNNEYTFTMPDYDVVVKTNFQKGLLYNSTTKLGYNDMKTALEDANNNETIVVVGKVITDSGSVITAYDFKTEDIETYNLGGKTVTIDINQGYLRCNFNVTTNRAVVSNGTLIVENGTVYNRNAPDDSVNAAFVADSGATIILQNGSHELAYASTFASRNGGTVKIKSGSYFDRIYDDLISAVDSGSNVEKRGIPSTSIALVENFFYVSEKSKAVATVTTGETITYHDSLEYAVDNTQDNSVINMVTSIDKCAFNESLKFSKNNVTLNLNGVDLYSPISNDLITVSGSLTINGSSSIDSISSSADSASTVTVINVNKDATLNISNVLISAEIATEKGDFTCISNTGSLNVNNCEFNTTVCTEDYASIGIKSTNKLTIDNTKIKLYAHEDSDMDAIGIQLYGGESKITNSSIIIDELDGSAKCYGIECDEDNQKIESVDINITSGRKASRCIYSSTAIVTVLDGHFVNNNSRTDLQFDTASKVEAMGGYYTKVVSDDYYDEFYYYCKKLDTPVEYKGITYTYQIVPTEYVKLTTSSNTSGTIYSSVQHALDAIKSDDTDCKLTLLKDITDSKRLSYNEDSTFGNYAHFHFDSTKEIELDMNGHDIDLTKSASSVVWAFYVENARLKLTNSSNEDVNFINSSADVIHVGYTTSGNAKLIIDDINNTIHLKSNTNPLAENKSVIKAGWNYGTAYTGDTTINGGCYAGNMTIEMEGSTYSISGGYYTDGELYTGYSTDKTAKKGSKASYIAPGYACILTPSTDSHYANYKYMVVPDISAFKPSFKTYSYTLKDLVTLYIYFVDFSDAPTHTLTDGHHYLALTATDDAGNITTSKKVLIKADQIEEGGSRYVISFDGFIPKHYANLCKAQIVDEGGNVLVATSFSIAKFCKAKIDKTTNPVLLKNICNTLANYGAYSQQYFKYNLTTLANAGLNTTFGFDEISSDMTSGEYADQKKITYYDADGNEYTTAPQGVNVTAVGQSLILGDTTPIRYYFNLDSTNYRVRYTKGSTFDPNDCKTASFVPVNYQNDGVSANYYVQVEGVKYSGYALPFTVRIEKQNDAGEYIPVVDVTYSVDSYTYEMINKLNAKSSLTDDEKITLSLMKSMYLLKKHGRIYYYDTNE